MLLTRMDICRKTSRGHAGKNVNEFCDTMGLGNYIDLINASFKRDSSKMNCNKEYEKGTVNKDFGNETGQGNENRFSKVTLT